MNVNGIGATGYPAAGYETRRARRNYADQMCNMVPATQSSGGTFELHISNDKDGKAIGTMCGADYSLTVYQPKDFDPANPVYKVKVWDKGGNVTERIQKDEKTGLEFVINMDQPFSCNVPMTGELKGILNEIAGKRGIDLKEVPLQGGLIVNQDPRTGLRYLSIQGNEAKGMSVVATSKEDLEIIEKLADEFTKYSVSSQRSTAGLYALLEISGNLKREGEGMTFLTPNGITYIPYDGDKDKAWEIEIPSSDYSVARKYLAMGIEASNYQAWLSKFNSARLLDMWRGLFWMWGR